MSEFAVRARLRNLVSRPQNTGSYNDRMQGMCRVP